MESTRSRASVSDGPRLSAAGTTYEEATTPQRTRGCPLTSEQWLRIASTLHLTPRELQVVRSLFQGLDEKQIAVRLALSRHTVHTHLGRLYRKLEVDSARGLLLRVFHELLPRQA